MTDSTALLALAESRGWPKIIYGTHTYGPGEARWRFWASVWARCPRVLGEIAKEVERHVR